MHTVLAKSLTIMAVLLLTTTVCCGGAPEQRLKSLRLRERIPPTGALLPLQVLVEIETEQKDASKGITAMATFINRGPAAVEVTNPELTSFLNISATDGTELDVPASDKFRDFFDDPPHTPRAPLKMSLEPGKALRVPIVVTEVLAPGSGYIRKQMDGGATGTTGIGAPSAEEIAAGKLKWPPRRIPLAPGTYTVSVHVGLLPADTDLIPGRFLDSETVRVKLGSNAP